MSEKNDTDLACHNAGVKRHHQLIFDNFGRSVAETVSYQIMIYFPPPLTNVSALRGET